MLMPPVDSYRSTRAEGMGGAAVAVADDGDAVFLNPAGVGREDGFRSKLILRGASFPNLTFGANKYTLGLYRAYQGASDKQTSVEKTILSARSKDTVYGYASAFPYITVLRFQMGVLASAWGEGSLARFDTPQTSEFTEPGAPLTYDRKITATGLAQAGAVAGFSLPYKNTGFALGVAGRFAYRNSFNRAIEASETVARKSSGAFLAGRNSTRGAALDLGALYDIDAPANPAIGVTVRDVGDTTYAHTKSGGHDEIERTNISAGVSLRPEISKSLGVILAADVSRIPDGRLTLRDKVKMGVEVGFGGFVAAPFVLRAGYDLRAPSVGLGVDLVFLRLDASYFGDTVQGTNGSPTRVDMRTLMKATIDLRI